MRTPSTVLIPQGSRELPHVTAGETNSRTGWPHVSPRDTPLANSGLQSRGCAPAAGPGYLLTTISPRGSSLVRHHTVGGGRVCPRPAWRLPFPILQHLWRSPAPPHHVRPAWVRRWPGRLRFQPSMAITCQLHFVPASHPVCTLSQKRCLKPLSGERKN